MEAQLITRAMSRCTLSSAAATRPSVSSSHSPCLRQLTARRHKATTARTKRALNLPPHPSFLAASGPDRIVFNPPASAASVYHTPFKFLPKSDPRRRANLNSLFASSTTLSSAPSTDGAPVAAAAAPALPPVAPHGVPHDALGRKHLRQADVDEMRRLRGEDPLEWSVLALARRFECSPVFVMQAVRAAPEHRAAMRQKLDEVKKRWGPIRTKARVDRRKRKEMLWSGEL